MQIAKTENSKITQVGHYKTIFPHISFPPSGPSEDFMAENNCLPISNKHPGDKQKLIACDPYIEDGKVFTVKVVDCDQSEVAAEAVQQAKAKRRTEVAALVVTTQSGKTFDGNEESQNRMARAIATSLPDEQTLWVLADNTPVLVSREELQEALRLASIAQTQLWIKPYI